MLPLQTTRGGRRCHCPASIARSNASRSDERQRVQPAPSLIGFGNSGRVDVQRQIVLTETLKRRATSLTVR